MFPGWSGEGPGFRKSDEDCPVRPGPGLKHVLQGSMNCVYCGALIYITPPIPEVTEVTMVNPDPEQSDDDLIAFVKSDPWDGKEMGLLDGLLIRRTTPDLKFLVRFLGDHDYAVGFQAGIDQALDVLVPALKRVMMLDPVPGASGTTYQNDVHKIIGKVPLRRTVKGWE